MATTTDLPSLPTDRPLWPYRSLSGLLAAAVALGAGELAAALLGTASLVVAVGNVVVDLAPESAVRWAIDVFGTNDKPVLLAVIVLASLLIGAALGPLAARYGWVGGLAFFVFGAVAANAGALDPSTRALAAFGVATLAAVAGWTTLHFLLQAVPEEAPATWAGRMPGRGVADRRRFLAFAGTASAAAAASVATGRFVLGPAVDVESQRRSLVLPTVEDAEAPAPAGFDYPGLSPLITPNGEFYRIDTALVVPRVDVSSWRLKVHGLVDRPYELTFEELSDLVSLEESATLVCVSNEVGGSLAGNAVWLGVPLRTLLERAGLQEGATQVVGRSVEGFTVGFPVEVAFDGRAAMVAIGMNGEPLPADHGFPARLVVPGLYGYVSATKWLSEIELTRFEDFDAYWIRRGWAKEAPIKTQSRIDVPRGGRRLLAGRAAVAGVAWGGNRGISRVEVRILPMEVVRAAVDARGLPLEGGPEDDAAFGEGGGWVEARLGEELNGSSWRQWVTDWDATTPGEYRIEVRATDGEGVTQTSKQAYPMPDGATGYHRVFVTVT